MSLRELATHDLHFHFDGAITPHVVSKLMLEKSIKDEKKRFIEENCLLKKPLVDLREFFLIFEKIRTLFDSKVALGAIVREIFLEQKTMGIISLDFRFGCGALSKALNCTEQEVLEVFIDGFKFASEIGLQISPTLCFSRHEPMSRAQFLEDFLLSNCQAIQAIDLEGPEDPHPTRKFTDIFQKLKSRGFNITVHAGEFSGSESIWQAIDDCGAERIGHGFSASKDPVLLRRLARDKIPIEVCPTSNYYLGLYPDLAVHPLLIFLEYGIPILICTDDPAIFRTNLASEYELVAKILEKSGINPLPILKQVSKDASSFSFFQSKSDA